MSKGVNYKLVYIEWEDSFGCSPSWEEIEDRPPVVSVCRSVGWLVHNGDKCKVVIPHLNQPDHPDVNQQGCGDMTIPASAILKITDLKIPKQKVRRG